MKQRFVLWIDRPEIRFNCVQAIDDLPREIAWQVDIKPYVKNKTQDQLGYLWGAVLPAICQHIEDSVGDHYTSEEVYGWMIDEYAEDRVVTINGKPKVIKLTASKMHVKEMSEFIDRIINHAAMYMGLQIQGSDDV